ncbi:MAG: CRTAC1 family protein [Abitibacteriaceae bacterium]|nr:CRTAC1 family protein [Abditibacteriaceae bacterium]
MRHRLLRNIGYPLHRVAFLTAISVGCLLLGMGCLTGCSPSSGGHDQSLTPAPTQASGATAANNAALFVDEAAPAGLKFKHDLGNTGHFYFSETLPAGCAFVDYNNDSYPDIFLVQSGPSGPLATVKQRPFCALYRNNKNGTFTDVTAGSGLDKDLGYTFGVAVADYDNDGYDDLFITAYGGNHLFHNLHGSGRFEDVTARLGLAQPHGSGFATSAAWGDYDNDGRLDLYVCYYAEWNHAVDKHCGSPGHPDYCLPTLYRAVTHQLFHNTPSGFVDVSEKAGISRKTGRGLAVSFLDYDNDNRQDIFVACDITPNLLWHNNGDGTFTESAVQAGCAYGEAGKAMAGMGIAIADYDHSGQESLYVSNFSEQQNILFKNNGTGIFEDVTAAARMATMHLKFLSFGNEFFDYDADGWSDLIMNNGHVEVQPEDRKAGVPLQQRKQLLHNEGNGTFHEITDSAMLGGLSVPVVGRGLAVGDYDNDGRVDVLAVAQNAPAQLLHNRVRNNNHWVSFKTVGVKSNRNGVGARFEIKVGPTRRVASVRAGSSYLSTSDRRVYFGLGPANKVDEVILHWPSGTHDVLKNVPADAFYTVTEGRGITDKKVVSKANSF